jgi:hypothetical protein
MDTDSIDAFMSASAGDVEKISLIVKALALAATNVSFFEYLSPQNKIHFMTHVDEKKFHQIFTRYGGYRLIPDLAPEKIRKWISSIKITAYIDDVDYVEMICLLIKNNFLTFDQVFDGSCTKCVTIKEYVPIVKNFVTTGIVPADNVISKILLADSKNLKFADGVIDLFETCLYYVDDVSKILWARFEKVKNFDMLKILAKFLSNKVYLVTIEKETAKQN